MTPQDLSPPRAGTWVLLRGLTREVGHWGDFPGLMSAASPGDRVLALDLAGNGALHRERSPTRIAAMTERCREQLQRLGIAPPYRVLAMSMGAMVAADWAVRHPHELQGCVLINTSLRPHSPWYRRLRPASYLPLSTLLWGRSAHEQERTVLRLTSRLRPPTDPVVGHWTALRLTRPVSPANAWRQLLAAACYRAPRQPPAVPMLLLCSRDDALVHPSCSRRLARAWGAALVEHPAAGHDLPLDDARWVVAQATRWAAA